MSETLKPCPFCGCVSVCWSKEPAYYEVWCSGCDAGGPTGATVEAAISGWNRRTPTPEQQAVPDPTQGALGL